MEHPSPIRIVLADHQQIFRDGLKSLLDSEPNFVVIGWAGSGLHALRMVHDLHPDVLLLDLTLPGGGLNVLRSWP
jgi:DNA-binding NarL/FixJ family response regulator